MIKQYKNIIILVGAIIIVAAGAILIPRAVRHSKKAVSENAAPSADIAVENATPLAEAPVVSATIAASADTRTPAERQKAYDEVLEKNKDVTIRLGDKCAITIPMNFTVTAGTQVLIVNGGSSVESLDMKTGEKGAEKKVSVSVRPSRYTFRTVNETTSLGCNGLSTAARITVK